MLKEFKIEILGDGDHYLGSTLEGKLTVSVDRPKRFRAVVIKLSGKATGRRYYHNQTGFKQITYVDNQLTVWTAENSPDGVFSGEQTFTFQFKLPLLTHKGIKYAVSAIIERSKFKRNYSVNIPLVLKEQTNKEHLTEEPQTTMLSKRFKFTSGSITGSASIPRTGFSVGQSVPLTVNLNNLTSRTVQVSSALAREDLSVLTSSFEQRIIVIERRGALKWSPPINAGENKSFQMDLQIPELIVPLLPNFPQYFIVVEVKIPWSSKKEVRIPLLIESQDGLQQQYQFAVAGMLSNFLQTNPNGVSVQQPGSAGVDCSTIQQQKENQTPPSYSEAMKEKI